MYNIFYQCSGITIGFYCPATYYVNEDAGSVSVTMEVLRGTPTRDIVVTLQTVDGSAVGKAYQSVSDNVQVTLRNCDHSPTVLFLCS